MEIPSNPLHQDVIFETQDGSHSILSTQYGVPYHSKYGAVQESRHVFIEAGLYFKSFQKKELAILELGFGTGLNALLTLLEAEQRGWKIYYETVEAFPVLAAQVHQFNYTRILNATQWQAAFLRMHEGAWATELPISPNFTFRKIKEHFQNINASEQFDIIYFDPFAPSAQPELWEAPLLKVMYQALLPQGVLVTYCAKGVVKRALKSVGFQVESLPGPPGKREMTRAIKP